MVSQKLPTNEATGHIPTQEYKQTKKINGYETHISSLVHCGLHALEVTTLNVVANNLLRRCFNPSCTKVFRTHNFYEGGGGGGGG